MGIESREHHMVDRLKSPVFLFSVLLVHILYIAVFLGIVYMNESYIRILSTIIQAFVSVFLAYRFNPFNEIKTITKFDRDIIFYLATFLLLNVVATEVYTSFFKSDTTDQYIQTVANRIKTVTGILPTHKTT